MNLYICLWNHVLSLPMYVGEGESLQGKLENSVLLMLSSFFILRETRLIELKNENGMVNSDICHSAESK